MTFGSSFGRTFSPTFQPKSQAAAAVASDGWWNLDGTLTSCIAAYQAKAAADYAASKVNLANPGTYNATNAAAYPDWASATGWTFERAKSERLETGIAVAGGYSIIFRIANASGTSSGIPTAHYKSTGDYYNMHPINASSQHRFGYGNSGGKNISGAFASGVMALTPAGGYLDGNLDVNLSSYSWTDSGTSMTFPIGARARGDSSSYDEYFNGDIIAIAFYNATLTKTNIGDLTTAMNAL